MGIKQIIVFLVVFAGCGLDAPQKGDMVSDGIAQAHFEARGNSTDIVQLDVLFPSQGNGLPAPGGPFAAVVFIQGGNVETERYAWQALELVKAGYVVAMPKHPLNLAFFSIENGAAARELLVNPPNSVLTGLVDAERIGVAGHSLGGVVAVKLALLGGFKGLVVEASYADTADEPALKTFTVPTLSLAGEKDCDAALETVRKGWQKFPGGTVLATVAGATHYQFTESDAPDLKKGCASGISLQEAHQRIGSALKRFFDAALFDGSTGVDSLKALDGVSVEVR